MAKNPCKGPECVRFEQVKGFCKAHYAQWRRYPDDLRPLGDSKRLSDGQKRRWAGLTDSQRAERLRPFLAGSQHAVRNEQWLDRLSQAHKARWESGVAGPQMMRICKGCLADFKPNSGNHFFCTPECEKATRRVRRYGIGMGQYLEMLHRQGNRCALCGMDWHGWCSQKDQMPHIDHCHKTGRVRGLLCGDCNTALGRFGDDPVRLRAAAAYLERVADEEAPSQDVAEASPAA